MGRGVASDPFLMWETDNSNQINKITCYAQVAYKKYLNGGGGGVVCFAYSTIKIEIRLIKID